jgi:hypothetical protein
VHATSGADLAIFANEYFDFVYSYIVFQHIPERAIVLNYLREAQRVLKPGGVLYCQLAGTPPCAELVKESETWAGCYFNASEMEQFAREERFPLVALSGLDTQYMWTTFRKSLSSAAAIGPKQVRVRGVTAASGPEARIPNRGGGAAISLWIEGMPDSVSLSDFRVLFGEHEQTGCYLSPVLDFGGCQVNARLPDGLVPGKYVVRLKSENMETEGAYPIQVEAGSPFRPRLLSVTDGVNLSATNRTDTRSLKVTIEDVRDPHEYSFQLAGHAVECLQYQSLDPITATFVFSFGVNPHVSTGPCSLAISLDGLEMEPVNVEVLA